MSLMDDQARLQRIVEAANRSGKLYGPLQAVWAAIAELVETGARTFSLNDIRDRLFLPDGVTYVWEVSGPYHSEMAPARACGLATNWLVRQRVIEIADTVENTQQGNKGHPLWLYRLGSGTPPTEASDSPDPTPAATSRKADEDDLFGDILVGLEARPSREW